jgi:glucan phosphoethanolaminetransferase (alkaline phosphatase superfamily)
MQNRTAILKLVFLILFLALCAGVNAIRISPLTPLGHMEHQENIAFGVAFVFVLLAIAGRTSYFYLAYTGTVLLLLPIEWFLRVYYSTTISATFVGMALETHWHEVVDFLTTYGHLLMPVLIVWGLLMLGLWRYRKTLDIQIPNKWRISILLILLSTGFMMHQMFLQQEPDWIKPSPDPFRVEPLSFWSEKWRTVFPTNIPLAFKRHRDDQLVINSLSEKIVSKNFMARQNQVAGADTVVLVIGESSRADRWSAYGYQRNTTPKLAANKDIVFLNDVVTMAIATRQSVPSIISRTPVVAPDNKINLDAEPSLIKAFSEAGFATAWFSTQSMNGAYDTPISFYSREADTRRFLNITSWSGKGVHDEVLLPVLQAQLKLPGKQMVVLHTMGSHFNYAYRHPMEFDKFTPSLSALPTFTDPEIIRKIETNNSYDNSIAYTDYFLDKVLEETGKRTGRSVVIYLSDHGEDIFEPGCVSNGVARTNAVSFRIPAFVWTNNAYTQLNSQKMTTLKQAATLPWKSNFVFQTALDLAGIDIATNKSTPSLIDIKTSITPRSVVGVDGKWTEFEAAEKRNKCRIISENSWMK